MLGFLGSFFGLLFVILIVLCVFLAIAYSINEKKKENEKKKRAERYRNSSAIKIIAEKIRYTSPLPTRIEVHSHGVIFYQYGEYRDNFVQTDFYGFKSDFDLTEIPTDCICAVTQALAESSELQALYTFSGEMITSWYEYCDDSYCELDLKSPPYKPPKRPQSCPKEWY